MHNTGGSIKYEGRDNSLIEEKMFTYSEEDKQENEISRSNSKLIFSPKFIPLYPTLLKDGFTITEALVFGFIDFYTSNASSRFYFTNEQIGEMLCISRASITNAVAKLEKLGLIETHRRIRSGGGQIRFINPNTKNPTVQLLNISSLTTKKVLTNNNKIKDNKINKNKRGREVVSLETTTHNGLLVNMTDSKQEIALKDITPDTLVEISQKYQVSMDFVSDCWDSAKNWLMANGKRKKNYIAFLSNWVKKEKQNARNFSTKRGGVVDARTATISGQVAFGN